MELICKQKVIDNLKEFSTMLVAGGDPILAALMNRAIKSVEKQPSVDAVEVVHGRWIMKQEPITWCEDGVDVFWECSICQCRNFGESPYCPNCGAKMDGDGNGTA